MPDSKNTFTFDKLPEAFVETSARWVRVKAGDVLLASSKEPKLLLQYGPRSLPTYFFDAASVDMSRLVDPQEKDNKRYWDVALEDQRIPRAAWSYVDPPQNLTALAGHISFSWRRDAITWLEEELELFAHARDPYKRVDALPSSRHVKVLVNDVVVAETNQPTLLFETYLPVRYYIPVSDVRLDLLEASNTRTACPYKGWATYWSVKVGNTTLEDVVWCYEEPIPENPRIKGLLAFFNEKVDLVVDGVRQERPRSPWS